MVTRILFSFNILYAPSANSKEEDEEDEEDEEEVEDEDDALLSLCVLGEVSLFLFLLPNLMIRYDPFATAHDTFFKELIVFTSLSENIEGIHGINILLLSIILAVD